VLVMPDRGRRRYHGVPTWACRHAKILDFSARFGRWKWHIMPQGEFALKVCLVTVSTYEDRVDRTCAATYQYF